MIDGKKVTLEEAIQRVESNYGKGRFDFSETTYYNRHGEMTVKCNECGEKFRQRADSLFRGRPLHCTCKSESRNYRRNNAREMHKKRLRAEARGKRQERGIDKIVAKLYEKNSEKFMSLCAIEVDD